MRGNYVMAVGSCVIQYKNVTEFEIHHVARGLWANAW